jgi:chemotaxis protein MotB
MSQIARASWWIGLALLAGCADNSLVLKGQVDRFQQQQAAMTQQYQQLQTRANALDRDNQELGAMLAQTRQQSKVIEEQLAGTRDQLRTVTAQLAQSRSEKATSEKKVEALNASMRRQGGTTITPNNNLAQTLPNLNLPPGYVRADGDVVRVALPGSQLFEPGTARLRPAAVALITQAGNELLRLYPDQIIGVEGYTDIDPVVGGQWRNNHELSVARAMTVYDTIVSRTRVQPTQLFVTGHGANHPVASNATPEGKETNRRVELVVYPEKKG